MNAKTIMLFNLGSWNVSDDIRAIVVGLKLGYWLHWTAVTWWPQEVHSCKVFYSFFFLFFNFLIGWQLSIWNYCKQFLSSLYNCQLLCFWRHALSIVFEVFPWPFFQDIAPSRMFTTNSWGIILCPIHEWRLFLFFIFKSLKFYCNSS
jgi:hypothetical protein